MLCRALSFPQHVFVMCQSWLYFLPSPEYHKFFSKINKVLSRIFEITRGKPFSDQRCTSLLVSLQYPRLSLGWNLQETDKKQNNTWTPYPGIWLKKKSFDIQATFSRYLGISKDICGVNDIYIMPFRSRKRKQNHLYLYSKNLLQKFKITYY